MTIKITSYQKDATKLQADVHYKIAGKSVYKRWLIPIDVYASLPNYKREKACENWAQNKLVEIVSKEKEQETTDKTTLDQFYVKWLEWLGQKVKPATVDNYDRAYKNHVQPFWGKRELIELSNAGLIVKFKTYLSNKTRLKNGDMKLAISSKNNIQAALGSICEFAHALTLIPYRPKIRFETQERTDLSDKKYTIKQQQIILEAALEMGKKEYLAVLFGLDCGFRRGELLAIEWQRIHADYVEVKYNISVIKGNVNIGSTKSGKAGKVALSSRVIAALNSVRPENAAGRIFDGLMPWDVNNMTRNILKKAHKIDKKIVVSANFHKFRHNCASNLADMEFYITKIKEHLRHQSLDTTMIYVHTGSIKETKTMLDSIGLPEKKDKLKLVK